MQRSRPVRGATYPPSNPVEIKVCVCGGFIIYRGSGKRPMQCDKCRNDKRRERAREFKGKAKC